MSTWAALRKGQPPSSFSPYRIATLPDGPEEEYLCYESTLSRRRLATCGNHGTG